MRSTWDFFSTERILFGHGAILKLGSVLKRLNAVHVFLITDPGIKQTGIIDRVVGLLQQDGYQVVLYDKAVPEPPIQTVIDCYEFAKSRVNFDVIVGVGGGSSIDLAKVVSLLLAHGGDPLLYVGENKAPGPILPLVAIPTTAGTGSEVTSVAVLTDVEKNLKVGISDHHLRPTVALLDPDLTLGLPTYITACTGVDALSHSIEAYMAKDYKYIQGEGEISLQGSNPIADALALEALKLITQNLVLAVQQGSNVKARTNMMLGSLMAGMAFSSAGVAAAHALALPIGGVMKSPHGEVTGLLIPHVMKFNSAVQKDKLRKIADVLNIQQSTLSDNEVETEVFNAIIQLLQNIGLPTSLSEIGIVREDIPNFVEKALKIDRLIRNNPRVPTQKDVEELLYKAL